MVKAAMDQASFNKFYQHYGFVIYFDIIIRELYTAHVTTVHFNQLWIKYMCFSQLKISNFYYKKLYNA